jgi:glycosyltransferase involved in cell wall biosynthesis
VRVVYVSSLPKGGPVSHLLVLAPALARAGADVQVLCLNEEVADLFRTAGVAASVAPLQHKGDVPGAARTWKLLRDADVVHTHDRRAGLLVRPPARLRGALVVHSYHGLPEEIAGRLGRDESTPSPPGVSRARIAWLLHGYSGIESILVRFGFAVAPSRAMARFLAEHGIPRGRIHVVPNGIDLPPKPPTRKRKTAGDQLVLGTAANLEYHKGIDVLLAACARSETKLRLELFGEGSWRGRLEQQAAALGVDARFAGHVDDVRERMRELDLFVLPSRAENFPLAALEAMAAALPVLATRVGGIPEVVLHGETGAIVEPDDPSALAASIDELARDRNRLTGLGDAGWQRASSLFDADRMAARMKALYEGLR